MTILNPLIGALLTLLALSTCREIIILETLTLQQKIKLLLNNQLRESIVKYPHFNRKEYMCMVSVEQIFSDPPQRKQPIHLPITINHQFSEALKTKPAGVYEMIMRRLTALEGHCVYYYANVFIWQYCHGYSVRQFDDDMTFATAVKKNMEEFSLGVFHSEKLLRDAINLESIMETKKHNQNVEKVNRQMILPERLIINHETSQWKIQDHSTKRIFKIHLKSNLIQVYPPLDSRKIIKTNDSIIEFKCIDSSQNVYAFALSPYELLPTTQIDCAIQPVKLIKAKLTAPGNKKLRLLRDYLYGDYLSVCSHPKEGILKEGMTIIIQLIAENGRYQTELTVRTILKIDPYYVQMNQTVGVSFKNKLYGLNQTDQIYGIKFCVISDAINYTKSNYVASMQSQEIIQGKQMELYCLSKFSSNIYERYKMTVNEKVEDGSYKSRMLRQDGNEANDNDEFILKNCWKIHSFELNKLVSLPEKEVETYPELLFNTIRIQSKGKIVEIFQDSSYHIVNIPEQGFLKLHSYSISTGHNHTYLLSRLEPLVKMEHIEDTPPTFEDAFYVNHTAQNTLLSHEIHILQIHQGGYFNAIWRYNDSFMLPRMNARDEVFVGYEAVKGSSNVRRVNMTKTEAQINQYVKWLKSYSLLEGRNTEQVEKWQDLPLEQVGQFVESNSFLVNYSYSGGSFCGDPVNKSRDTIVHLSCGSTWMKLVAVSEKSPCSYELYVSTKLLCEGGYYSAKKEAKKPFIQDMVCFPSANWE